MMSPEKQKVFDALWAKMVEHGDFPTLSHSIHHIVGAVQSQSDHLEKLVSAVISDFSLTQKVLRLANSAMYAPFGGNVTTVSRAILVLGHETLGPSGGEFVARATAEGRFPPGIYTVKGIIPALEGGLSASASVTVR